ncbi:uncharacterized protein C8Q71DRAFT_256926 [Rhodofomes roseus]|uniref:GST N-terminal domain-containing protein n=1 Tax=Rhodofomes roseus TaxID=34475 RepID=A0A4Y9XQW7_9APHY|nr:uncharacterized protein C8Q71DRAFT_256926 [Rhodofomes roseus]KAH9832518.1 hypothetical protein C8Q71DRAFT_256926 [Rhodofomes roseus]TFY52168.1 hypothetical protein EVJ58_g10161 [Rhodofomes roseus]
MALPDTDVIIFYDIPGTVPGSAWSPNTWKTRFALNYKGLPYRTEWVEYPDIATVLPSLGVEPSTDSTPYTLPAIYDPRTRKTIMDSNKISLYLDETYPDTPVLLSAETRVFQTAFEHAFRSTLHSKLMPLIMYRIAATALNPPSSKYFFETREKALGVKLEELSPPGSAKRTELWVEAEKGFTIAASWFEAAGDGRLLLSGDGKVTHADTYVAGCLIFVRLICGPESEDWKRVEGLNGGFWKRYLAAFEKWADTSR